MDGLATRINTCATTDCGFKGPSRVDNYTRAPPMRKRCSAGQARTKVDYVQTTTSRPATRTTLKIDSLAHAGISVGKIQVDGPPHDGQEMCATLQSVGVNSFVATPELL